MFVFERWIQIAKGYLHSPKGPEEGLMRGIMRHEYRVRINAWTKQHLTELLTPPPGHITTPFIELIGTGKLAILDNDIGARRPPNSVDQTTHRLIFRFLCSNDPLTNKLQEGLRRFLPEQARNGEVTLDEWNPSGEAMGWLLAEVAKLTEPEPPPTEREIMLLLQGPDISCIEYEQISVNGVPFCTLDYDGFTGNTTKSMLFYKMEGRRGQEVGTAHIERIFTITSSKVLRYGKIYKLLKVHNYVDAADHESELKHVKAANKAENLQRMPIIRAEDIHPLNIAGWPANESISSTMLIVFTKCSDEIY
jgi:hypothetical protein